MNKVVRIIQNYLACALPFVIACAVWSSLRSEGDILGSASVFTKGLWELLSWNLMLWFAALISFLILLVALPEARERTLKRLAGVKERDEREEYITGKASRAAYIATLSLLILLLFLSVFSLNITRAPENEAIDGKTKRLSIGLQFNMTDIPKSQTNQSGQVLFESKDLPLSKTAILFVLLSWQLVTFNLTARKELLREAL